MSQEAVNQDELVEITPEELEKLSGNTGVTDEEMEEANNGQGD